MKPSTITSTIPEWVQTDPLRFHKEFFGYPPKHRHHTSFYNRQREIIQSVVDNDTTVVVAANMLGHSAP